MVFTELEIAYGRILKKLCAGWRRINTLYFDMIKVNYNATVMTVNKIEHKASFFQIWYSRLNSKLSLEIFPLLKMD